MNLSALNLEAFRAALVQAVGPMPVYFEEPAEAYKLPVIKLTVPEKMKGVHKGDVISVTDNFFLTEAKLYHICRNKAGHWMYFLRMT